MNRGCLVTRLVLLFLLTEPCLADVAIVNSTMAITPVLPTTNTATTLPDPIQDTSLPSPILDDVEVSGWPTSRRYLVQTVDGMESEVMSLVPVVFSNVTPPSTLNDPVAHMLRFLVNAYSGNERASTPGFPVQPRTNTTNTDFNLIPNMDLSLNTSSVMANSNTSDMTSNITRMSDVPSQLTQVDAETSTWRGPLISAVFVCLSFLIGYMAFTMIHRQPIQKVAELSLTQPKGFPAPIPHRSVSGSSRRVRGSVTRHSPSDEDINGQYGSCLPLFQHDTSPGVCKGIMGDTAVAEAFANALQTEIHAVAKAFAPEQARVGMLYAGLGMTTSMNDVMAHAFKRAKAQTAFECQAEGSECMEDGKDESEVPAAVGWDKKCVHKLVSDKTFGTEYGLQRRMLQLANAFETTDQTLFWGGHRAIGAAVVVCVRLALEGQDSEAHVEQRAQCACDPKSPSEDADDYDCDNGVDTSCVIKRYHVSKARVRADFSQDMQLEEDGVGELGRMLYNKAASAAMSAVTSLNQLLKTVGNAIDPRPDQTTCTAVTHVGKQPDSATCKFYLDDAQGWLPGAYQHAAESACRFDETLNMPPKDTTQCIRHYLQKHTPDEPESFKQLMRERKAEGCSEVAGVEVCSPSYIKFAVDKFAHKTHQIHVDAYRACGCPFGPAEPWAWKMLMLNFDGIATDLMVATAIKYFGSCGCDGW